LALTLAIAFSGQRNRTDHTFTGDKRMDDLTHILRKLCLRNRDGSFAAQANRQRSLNLDGTPTA
jgi:hypothetical protein